jgi:hypothetical protein
MSCNCKKPNTNLELEKTETTNRLKILNTIFNFLTFLLVFVISVPMVVPFVGYLLFKSIVLKDNTINTFNLFYKIGKKLMESEDSSDDGELEDDDDDNYELELEDVELVNVEESNK